METQKTLKSQSNFKKEKWSWRNQASWFQTILQSYSHQNSMNLAQKQKCRSMNRIESPEINPHICRQLIFDKGGRIYNGEKTVSSINWKNWTAMCKKKNEIRTFFNNIHKMNSKWIKNLNWRPDSIKLIEENIGKTLFDINHSNRNLIKLKSFCTAKEIREDKKITHRMGENCCK